MSPSWPSAAPPQLHPPQGSQTEGRPYTCWWPGVNSLPPALLPYPFQLPGRAELVLGSHVGDGCLQGSQVGRATGLSQAPVPPAMELDGQPHDQFLVALPLQLGHGTVHSSAVLTPWDSEAYGLFKANPD